MSPFISLFLILYISGCGSSILKSAETSDPESEAMVLLEQGKGEAAKDLLQSELESNPGNYRLTALLASAEAMLVGIDEIRIALKLAAQSATSQTSESSNEISQLFTALPDATDENIAGLDTAIATMETIPAASRTSSDSFKLTIYFTARLSLVTKKFDKNGDGEVSGSELLDLNSTDATSILATLDSAEAAIAAASGSDASSAASASKISAIKAQIAAQPGATDEEKLEGYLGGA